MKYNIDMKNLCILLVTIFLLGGYVMAEDISDEDVLDLNTSALKINTQTREDVIKQESNITIEKENIKQDYNKYNPDSAYSKKTTSFKKEKKFKNIDVGAKYDTTFTPDNASQTGTLYSKLHLNDKASVDTSYASDSFAQPSGQMSGTVSVAPEYRFNQHFAVQNKYSKNTNSGTSKEEINFKINPFKDKDRMDFNAGVGQVQYTNGAPSSSQINFGTNFKF